jgi:hypothetical protein
MIPNFFLAIIWLVFGLPSFLIGLVLGAVAMRFWIKRERSGSS